MGVHKADRDKVVQWSVDFVDFFNVIPITTDTTQRLLRSANAMASYTHSLLDERRREPRDDFLGVLANAQATQGDITDDEIVGNTMLLLLAGHVAVRNLIGNAVYLLLTHPDQRAILQDSPTLLPNAIEETLRVEPPVTLIPRIALEDFDYQGNTIRRGQIVQLSIASANRDAAHFADADRFDVRRAPSQILSFGYGPHGCLGGHLARVETRIALETLFARMPGLRLDETRQIEWYRNAGNRGPITLPVVF
jgi:cytochrome P450